jgi:hypothetical protein
LAGLVERVRPEGGESADILLRPYFVTVDGLETGFVFQTDGEDESETEEDFADYSPESLYMVPFDKVFHRPWTTGDYDT